MTAFQPAPVSSRSTGNPGLSIPQYPAQHIEHLDADLIDVPAGEAETRRIAMPTAIEELGDLGDVALALGTEADGDLALLSFLDEDGDPRLI